LRSKDLSGLFLFFSMSQVLVQLDGVNAPTPIMHRDAAAVFGRLRNILIANAGFDFLARCGDVFRDAGFISSKDGVANRSWHKTGRAFDYNQEDPHLVIVSDPHAGKQYFRTYLKCARQDGTLGKKIRVRDVRGYYVDAYLADYTLTAESLGFMRIPAWSGWQAHYNRREFWHSQYNPNNLTWDAAMLELKGKSRPVGQNVVGLNDRGDGVHLIQTKLAEKGYLAAKEVDGIFGAKTKAAVTNFQRAHWLAADGLVGPATRAKLFD
jgi:hypothetical protein